MAGSDDQPENIEVVHEIRRASRGWEGALQHWPSSPPGDTAYDRDPLALLLERELNGAMLSLREAQRRARTVAFSDEETRALQTIVRDLRTRLDELEAALARRAE
jgi:hypothetical protein